MNTIIPYSLDKSCLILQTSTSSFHDRLNALRCIVSFINGKKDITGKHINDINLVSKQRLTQLVLESVLQIIVTEERTPDLWRRQVTRTECLLLLANLLESDVLFGDARAKLNELQAQLLSPVSISSPQKHNISLSSQISSPVNAQSPIQNYNAFSDDEIVDETTNISSPLYRNDNSGLYNTPTSSLSLKPRPMLGPPGGWVRPGESPTNSPNSVNQSFLSPIKESKSLKLKIETNSDDKMKNIRKLDKKTQSMLLDTLALSPVSKMNSSPSRNVHFGSPLSEPNSPFDSPNSNDSPLSQMLSKSLSDLSLLKPALLASKNRMKNKRHKNRPSVFFSSEHVTDNYALGTDPMNWIEQDRKLGYQKPRMWIPLPSVGIAAPLIPDQRPKNGDFSSDSIVKEYLQMQALISFIGDTVHPVDSKKNSKGSLKHRLSGAMDSNKFQEALKEVVQVWSPLVGSVLPDWVKSDKDKMDTKNMILDESIEILASPYAVENKLVGSDHLHSEEEKKIFFTKKILRDLLRKEKKYTGDSKSNLKNVLEYLNINDGESPSKIAQESLENYELSLKSQKNNLNREVSVIQKLLNDTVKLQYSSLPNHYLVKIEGEGSRYRQLLQMLTITFCREKRRNLLTVAMGTWKINLVVKKSENNRKLYHHKAASVLAYQWTIKFRKVFTKHIIKKWCSKIVYVIYKERNAAAILIQTTYRWFCDRKNLILTQTLYPYSGPLSNIELGRHRPSVKFFIPQFVRDNRRTYWMAAIIIQSMQRCSVQYRMYQDWRYKIRLIQSICRMWPILVYYRRLKAATIKSQAWARRTIAVKRYTYTYRCVIIIQKYVRRFICIIQKLRKFDAIWQKTEAYLKVPIVLQCRRRIKKAKARVLRIKRYREKKLWATLLVQRNWYRIKEAYATFVLMSAYRAREVEDERLEKLATSMGRYKAARNIQRKYKDRFFKVLVSSAVKIQCWYRKTQGRSNVSRLRLEKWASRKLHHWARGMMKYKHALVRKIQNLWWNCHPGNRIKHLWHRANVRDMKLDFEEREKILKAASRIQARVRGITARIWTKRHKAAITIQRPLKFFLARQRWKNWKRNAIRSGVRKFVSQLLERSVKDVKVQIIRKHSRMMIKPQKLVRGFICRQKMLRAKKTALQHGIAIVRIQRFWRQAGLFAEAVRQVLAIKRIYTNPFRNCSTIHELLVKLRFQCHKLYDRYDPRAGLKISSMLYRLGRLDMMDMFPRRQYLYVFELQGSHFNIDSLIKLYDNWQQKLNSKNDKKNDKKNPKKNTKKNAKEKKTEYPMKFFELLLSIVKPRKSTRLKSDLDTINYINNVQDSMTIEECKKMVFDEFCHAFGKNQISRATNLANSIADTAWTNHNQYQSIGGHILTKGQILHAIKLAKKNNDSSSVMDVLQDLRTNYPMREEEAQGDKRRINQSLEYMQSAIDIFEGNDSITESLPENIQELVHTAAAKAATYQKMFKFILDKKKHEKVLLKKQMMAGVKHNEKMDDDFLYEGVHLENVEILARHYNGPAESSEVEMSITTCKIYGEAFTKVYNLSSAIQSLKNAWHNKSHQRMLRKAKLSKFLSIAKEQYEKFRTDDHVNIIWKKLNRSDMEKYKFDLIMQAAALRRQEVEEVLGTIPKHGWAQTTDEYDETLTYWIDTTAREESTYEMPSYDWRQYLALKTIQKYARHYLKAYHERMRRKQEEKMKAIAEAEAEWAASLEQSKKAIKITLNFGSQNVEQLASSGDSDITESNVNIEQLLPKKLQLYAPRIMLGKWLFYLNNDGDYSLVAIIRIYGTGKVDIRNVKGEKFEKVSISHLFESPLTVGDRVEARYHKQIDFYKGKIIGMHDGHDGEPRFKVKYDDGDVESNITEDLIRLSSEAIRDFFLQRRNFFVTKERENARKLHFRKMKEGRADRQKTAIIKSAKRFCQHWMSLQGISQTKTGLISSEGSRIPTRAGLESPNLSKPGTRAGLASADSVMSQPSRRKSTAGTRIEEKKVDEPQQPPLIGLFHEAELMNQFENTIAISIKYTRRILKFGWNAIKVSDKFIYRDVETNETVHDPPFLTPSDEYYAKKIQTAWAIKSARKYCKKMLRQVTLGELLNNAVDKVQQTSFIGFKYEGSDGYMMLRRAGRFELADAIEKHFNRKEIMNKSHKNLSIEAIASFDPLQCEQIGIRELNDKTSLRQFQSWWDKTEQSEKDRALSFINYFDGYKDSRTIQKCIDDSYDKICDIFLKHVKGGQARTQMALKKLLADSIYPLTYAQIELYIKKYSDNADDVRSNIVELSNKQTTHTYIEEKKVYKMLKGICNRACVLLTSYKLDRIRRVVQHALTDAKNIMDSNNIKERNRIQCTGHEAKASLALRLAVEYILAVDKAASLVQRRTRCYQQRKHYIKIRVNRQFAVTSFQRLYRAFKVRKVTAGLKQQQLAEWEQLWDNRRNILYYHNRLTQETSYEEPAGPIRPLVRDRRSAALIQAWPHLNQNIMINETGVLVKPASPGLGPTTFSTICVECKVRKCVRFCLDCNSGRISTAPGTPGTPGTSITPYCFPCYSRIHEETAAMQNHRYNDSNQGSDFYLQCCMCDEPATRKCMGVLDEDQITSICNELQWATPDMWFKILQRTNVIGDKKLEMLLDRLKNVSTDEKSSPTKKAIVGNAQLLEIRSILERTRAECDECYCDSCYITQHSGGKRTAHRWTGFSKYALVCSICKSSPAESECLDCNSSAYCNSCFKVFHNRGRKKRHRCNLIVEEMNPADEPCDLCKRRAATRKCENFECGFHGCDCCYECQHSRICFPIFDQPEEESNYACSVCGEVADSKCARCGDLYCSKNYGCFYSMHSKGHRQNHKLVSL